MKPGGLFCFRLLLPAALAFLLLCPLAGAEVDELFARANASYREENFQEAIRIYQEILDQGWESGELYYNLGNAWFREGRLGAAILNFERARRLLPGDSDVAQNLEISNLRVVDKIEPLPEFILVRWGKSMVRALTLQGWLLLGLVFYWCLFLCLAARQLTRGSPFGQAMKRSAVLLTMVTVLAFSLSGARWWLDRSEVSAIVMEQEVAARSAPAAGAAEVFRIHEGTRVRAGTRSTDWTEIILADGKVGWVRSHTLEFI